MSEPNCHYCDRPAEEECPTCGRLYCSEHGDDVCLRCMAPESAAPGSLVYRGSVLALLVAVAVAIFLIVRPPQSPSTSDTVRTIATATPATGATATPTPPGTPAPAGTTSGAAPSASAQPSASASANATGSTTPAPKTYTVSAGDTLSGIAAAHATTVDAIVALNPGVTATGPLAIGTVLKMP